MHIKDPAISIDSVVVVIGANGFIGVETCEKLLQAGYKVRGTVRNIEKHSTWMHKLFDEKWPGKFELVEVAEFEKTGTFDAAFKGAAGVIYVSTPVLFDPDPSKVVGSNIRSTINTLEAAAKAGVQRYVLSSSSKAVETTLYNDRRHNITTKMYNWEAVQKTCCGPRDDGFGGMLDVYSAGRTLAELSFWSWVEENNPPFVANCVVPDGNFGRGLNGSSSTNELLKTVLTGEWEAVPMPLAFLIDVEDTARLLVAAMAKSSIDKERVFAYHDRCTWNDLRQQVRKITPDLVKGEDQKLEGKYLAEADDAIQRAEKILQDIGQPGFVSVEVMLRNFLDTCY
ncbi:unnamed protein product [Clonostachys byssicola]|uniref:NAD-dependent epimerase/dehydratase domain-containing protein n=1 Tax=Clonostachys byssicola TaxID=160290 RepID=A0A9N9UNX3_9HYPO|nr:unnamed protein product [Clonostachys byssicola]